MLDTFEYLIAFASCFQYTIKTRTHLFAETMLRLGMLRLHLECIWPIFLVLIHLDYADRQTADGSSASCRGSPNARLPAWYESSIFPTSMRMHSYFLSVSAHRSLVRTSVFALYQLLNQFICSSVVLPQDNANDRGFVSSFSSQYSHETSQISLSNCEDDMIVVDMRLHAWKLENIFKDFQVHVVSWDFLYIEAVSCWYFWNPLLPWHRLAILPRERIVHA